MRRTGNIHHFVVVNYGNRSLARAILANLRLIETLVVAIETNRSQWWRTIYSAGADFSLRFQPGRDRMERSKQCAAR
jgi:hypothetical protein